MSNVWLLPICQEFDEWYNNIWLKLHWLWKLSLIRAIKWLILYTYSVQEMYYSTYVCIKYIKLKELNIKDKNSFALTKPTQHELFLFV